MRKTIFLFNLIFLPNVLHYYCGKSIALFVRTIEYISHKFMSNLVIPLIYLLFIDPPLGGFGVIFGEVMINYIIQFTFKQDFSRGLLYF